MNRPLRLIIYFVLLLFSFCSYGQIRTNAPKAELDSLIRKIQEFNDTELIDHLNLIATSISQRYPDSCHFYANQALELSKPANYELGEAEAIFNIGNGYFYKFDLKNALTNYLAALRIFEKYGNLDKRGNLLLQIGFINTFVGNHEKSLEYYRKAQFVFSTTGNQFAEIFARRKIGTAFRQMNNNDSALLHYNDVLYDYRQLGCKKYEAYVMNDIAITIVSRSPDESLIYYKNSLNLMREIGYTYGIAVRLENIGGYYHYYADEPYYQKAERLYLESIHEYKRIGRFASVAAVIPTLAEIYLNSGKPEKVIDILEKGLKSLSYFYNSIDTMVYEDPAKKFREYVLAKNARAWIYKNFVELFEGEGDYKKAHFYNNLRAQAEDSIYTESNLRITEVILANAENELNLQRIELLKKEKELQESKVQRSLIFTIGLGALVLIIVFMAIVYVRQNKLRTEQEKTNLQQKLLRSQMNPHFIFNSLSSIQGFIMEQNPKTASRYLSRFATLVRNILDSSAEELVPLDKEISTIENYLELQKARYEDKFEYVIEVDETLETETISIPPMLAQPFIENSIEHGFKHKDSKGNMRIQFGLNGNLIRFEVIDDGIGREKAIEILHKQNKDHRSMATDITRERLAILNKKHKKKITLEIIDLKNDAGLGIGTKVVFEIPLLIS